jgi:hypothetical protein
LKLSLHLPIVEHYARLKQGCAHHGVLDLIGREFGRNCDIGNLNGHGKTSNQKMNLFDPGLPTGSPSAPTGAALPVAFAPTGTHGKVN